MANHSSEGNNPAFTGPVDTHIIACRIATAVGRTGTDSYSNLDLHSPGPSGANLEYLCNLHKWMKKMAIRDEHVEEIYNSTQKWVHQE